MRKIVASILVTILLFSCSKKDEIPVGVILSLTGNIAPYGKNAMNGIELAAEEINSNGGIYGNRIKLKIEDDCSESKNAISSAQNLITNGNVKVVIGFIGSSPLMAAAPLFNSNQVVLISPGASSSDIANAGDYIFRTRPSGKLEAQAIAKYSVNDLRTIIFGILCINNDYGNSWVKDFSEEIEKQKAKIVAVESFTQNSTDMRTQILKIIKANPETVFIVGYLNENAIALRQLKELGFKGKIISNIGIENKDIFDLAPIASDNVFYASTVYDPSMDSLTKKFDKKYVNRFNSNSDLFSANAYDALYLIKQAIEKVGYDPEEIKNYLYKVKNYKGVSGKMSFDQNGDVIKPIAIKKTQNKEFITIKYF